MTKAAEKNCLLDGFLIIDSSLDGEMLATDDDDLCVFILGARQPGRLSQVYLAGVACHGFEVLVDIGAARPTVQQ